MNILFCGDKNIFDGLMISIISLMKNTNSSLYIYVMTAHIEEEGVYPLTDKQIKYLDKIVKKKSKSNFVSLIDATDLFKKELPISNMKTRFTPCCMLRLFSDSVDLPSKILYLDNDVIIRKDIKELYETNMDNYEICGVLDHYGKWFFRKNILKKDYINSGVLLMNLDNIKKTDLFKKCRLMCINKNMFMPDQSALNKLSINKLIVDRKYNEQKKTKENTCIRHFTTTFTFFPFVTRTIKPWQIERVHNELKTHEYDDILNEYLKVKDNFYE